MINRSYANQSLLTLFGRGDPTALAATLTKSRAARAAAPPIAPVAVPPAPVPAAAAAPASPQSVKGAASAEDGTRTTSHWDKEPRTAALLKLAAQREAVEVAFEAENGFRRRVDANVMGRYEAALSGNVSSQTFASHDEAARWALHRVTSAAGNLLVEADAAGRLTDAGHVQMVAEADGLSVEVVKARMEDGRLAVDMEATFEAAVLQASFEVTGGPLLAERDGSRLMNNVEVRREGRLVLTVTDSAEYPGQKVVTTYDAKGEVASQETAYGGKPADPAGDEADGA